MPKKCREWLKKSTTLRNARTETAITNDATSTVTSTGYQTSQQALMQEEENKPLIFVDQETTCNTTADTSGAEESSTNIMEGTNDGFAGPKIALAILGFFVVISLFEFAFVVPPGMVGIVVTLGEAVAFQSGLHYRVPLISHLEILSGKTQLLENENVIPTKEGLSVTLDTAVLFRLDVTKAAELYQKVGSDYITTLIEPEAASAVRGLTSESEAKALYSSGRSMIQDSVKEELTAKLGPRGILIEDVLLKDIKLPELLTKSIELKAQAEQDAARMEFVLQKEKQEAERKAIEAGGIADFQRIVSEGISPELLKWKGVEATEKFADAPNTKIVIMGNDANGLPVILSAGDE